MDDTREELDRISYWENRFSSKECRRLYTTASSPTLKSMLRKSDFKDKRFQNDIISENVRRIFFCQFNNIPIFMNARSFSDDTNKMVTDIARWRLTIQK